MLTDAIDLSRAVFHSRNVADWPIVTSLTGVEFRDADPQGGVRPIADIPWPDITPAGWDGPITHAIWLGRKIDGVWHIACALEFYRGKDWTGAPLHKQYADWFSPGKGFGELEGLGNVQSGEPIAFMLTHGSQRLKDTSTQQGPRSRQERSNVIVVTFTANGIVTPVVPPSVIPPPTQAPTGESDRYVQLSAEVINLKARMIDAEARIAALIATEVRPDAAMIGALQVLTARVDAAEVKNQSQDAALMAVNGRIDTALASLRNAGGFLANLFGRRS